MTQDTELEKIARSVEIGGRVKSEGLKSEELFCFCKNILISGCEIAEQKFDPKDE